jgi:hypothetical protein
MSRTIKHQTSRIKGRFPKMDKGNKNTMRVKILKELEENEI